MASFASSATTCGARKQAWTKNKKKKVGENNGQLRFIRHHMWRTQARLDQNLLYWTNVNFLGFQPVVYKFLVGVCYTKYIFNQCACYNWQRQYEIQFSLVLQTNLNYEREQFWREMTDGRLLCVLHGGETWSSATDKTELTHSLNTLFCQKWK